MTEQAVVQGKEELEHAVGAPSAELSEMEALEIIAQIDELLPQASRAAGLLVLLVLRVGCLL